jgi:glycosyltransferase involved in cell wall biosynthesis
VTAPRVLLIAEAANPEWVSVPLVGWSLAKALLAGGGVHVVTQVRNRGALERAGWVEGREFTAIDSEAVARPLWRLDQALRKATGAGFTLTTALGALPYAYFERLVWKRFGADLAARRFDLVHRVTPLSPTTPSPIARRLRRAGVPFVWGPINGGVAWPKGFGGVARAEGDWLSYVREAHRLLPGYASTRRDAAAILVASRATWEQLAGHHERCVYVPENAVDPERFAPCAREEGGPLRIAFVGRLVPYKGADMLLEAAAPLVRSGAATIDVLGEGPQRAALEGLAAREGLGAGITFAGWLPQAALVERLARAHVLGFPSIREFGGGVVLEAMALGVVPVVVDYAGPAELVTPETGIAVPLGPRAAIVAGVRRALEQLAADPAARARRAAAGRRRVLAHFTWSAKAAQVRAVWSWALGTAPKPDFSMPL